MELINLFLIYLMPPSNDVIQTRVTDEYPRRALSSLNVSPCSMAKFSDVSEEHTESIIRVEV
jgi:hypothetical protein